MDTFECMSGVWLGVVLRMDANKMCVGQGAQSLLTILIVAISIIGGT